MVGRGKPGHFGPGVIGDEAFAAEQVIVEKGEAIFGPGVIGDATLAGANSATDAGDEIEAPSNLDEFRKQLFAADQRGADALLAAELAREDGPRKTALNMLLEAEQARENGGRPAFIAAIERGLTVVRTP